VPAAPQKPEGGPQRIAKLLARAGIASRREIERMIAEGRIALNGEKLTTPATLVEDVTGITVDGRPVRPAKATRLFRFYKPQGTITAAHDPKGRPTIYDRLPAGMSRVMPVGRLDFLTEGLLLLTNDGELKRQLELPRTGVVRTYRARAYGQVTQAQLEDLADGVTVDGVHYGSINANLERRTGSNCWVEMSLTEGKNREVRNVLAHLGLRVSRLIRTAYGPLTVEDMQPGDIDEVPEGALEAFRKTLK
jgi:23S rRNA pseudouridine2605 synthase